jgi:phosphate transport system substrate-binding protein
MVFIGFMVIVTSLLVWKINTKWISIAPEADGETRIALRRKRRAVTVITLIAAGLLVFAFYIPRILTAYDVANDNYGYGFDETENIYWEDMLESENYKQIVTDSRFQMGEIKRLGSDPDDEDMKYYSRSFGTYPYLDGSTVCIPLAVEFARQHLGFDLRTAISLGRCFSTTHDAYMNLIMKDESYETEYSLADVEWVSLDNDRPVDLFLGTEPSQDELSTAEENSVELYKEPICLDAFVFIVNKANPLDSLAVEQIRGIYSGKITNWKEVGGEDVEILPYQRSENSGSQTGMENMVMGGEKMIPPLLYKMNDSMAGLVEGVAEYDNGKASIGYTYKYFIDVIYKNDNIKILNIDGVSPDASNVRNDTYPFTTKYYGVIRAEDKDKTGGKFLDWIRSDEGQKCVEQAGYIPLK